MLGAKDGGLGKQQQVATGKIDRFVRCARVRDMSTGGAPVLAVNIPDGKGKDRQGMECGAWNVTRQGAEETAEVAQFGLFPNETVTDEDGEHFVVMRRQPGQHHATVEAAADKGTNSDT